MNKVTMPEAVVEFRIDRLGNVETHMFTTEAAWMEPGSYEAITTTQAEAYADARVREALRSLLRDMNGHVRASHSRFVETGKPYDEGRRIAYEQAASDIRSLIPPPRGREHQ